MIKQYNIVSMIIFAVLLIIVASKPILQLQDSSFQPTKNISYADVSLDGSMYVFCQKSSVYIYEGDTSMLLTTLQIEMSDPADFISDIQLFNNDTKLAVVVKSKLGSILYIFKKVKTADVFQQQSNRSFKQKKEPVNPDAVTDPESETETITISALALTHDQKYWLFSNADGGIFYWNIETDEQKQLSNSTGLIIVSLHVSNDGKLLMCSGVKIPFKNFILKAVQFYNIDQNFSFNNTLKVTNQSGQGLFVSTNFSPNDKRFVSVTGYDNFAQIFDIATVTAVGQLNGHTGKVVDAMYSKDGKYIYTLSLDNSIIIWGADTYLQIERIKNVNATSGFVYSRGSGKLVLYGKYVKTFIENRQETNPKNNKTQQKPKSKIERGTITNVKSNMLTMFCVLILMVLSYVLAVFGYKHNSIIYYLQTVSFVGLELINSITYNLKLSHYQIGMNIGGTGLIGAVDDSLAYGTLEINGNIFKNASEAMLLFIIFEIVGLAVYVTYVTNPQRYLALESYKKKAYRCYELLFKSTAYPLVFFSLSTLSNSSWNESPYSRYSMLISIILLVVIGLITTWKVRFQRMSVYSKAELAGEMVFNVLISAAILSLFRFGYWFLILVVILRGVGEVYLRYKLNQKVIKRQYYLILITVFLEAISIYLLVIRASSLMSLVAAMIVILMVVQGTGYINKPIVIKEEGTEMVSVENRNEQSKSNL